MIITVTPNTAVDKTYMVHGFALDKVNRPESAHTVPGGKGVNVSRVLRTLGVDTIATGFIAGSAGAMIEHGLTNEEIPHDFVRTEGESRLCMGIIDPENGTQTEINEAGPNISEEDLNALKDKIISLLPSADYIAFCGSVPAGIPDDFYAEMIKTANDAGVKTVLDSSGVQLRNGIKASPKIIKPNTNELSQVAETEIFTLEEILDGAKTFRTLYGVETVAVTMGRTGAMVIRGDEAYAAKSPEIEFVSAVGSGDSFLAAFMAAEMKGCSLGECLEWATAAGAANAAISGSGFCTKEMIYALKEKIVAERICEA
ncbi:MAG: 1-phosphofructokinase [Abditibacteriota bacterium]|nr:1-phosphofructokinase [Abditibacteriota bacterium]